MVILVLWEQVIAQCFSGQKVAAGMCLKFEYGLGSLDWNNFVHDQSVPLCTRSFCLGCLLLLVEACKCL